MNPEEWNDHIAHQIEASKSWRSFNRSTMSQSRREGTLSEESFSEAILNHLAPFRAEFEAVGNHFLTGFEIEFYLPIDQVEPLSHALAAALSASQMLMLNLETEQPTDGRLFYLMAESTGKPPQGWKSFELVSPILDPRVLPYYLHTFGQILQSFSATDNEEIGFHLHISTRDAEKISPLALVFFLDQGDVFQWSHRRYTRDIVEHFFAYQPKDWQLIYEEINRKCYNLNLLHYEDHNRIELRAMGGTGYLTHMNRILKNCLAALHAMLLAKTTPPQDVAKKLMEQRERYPMSKEVIVTLEQDLATLFSLDPKQRAQQLWFSQVRLTAPDPPKSTQPPSSKATEKESGHPDSQVDPPESDLTP
jgi:hypothetical protein